MSFIVPFILICSCEGADKKVKVSTESKETAVIAKSSTILNSDSKFDVICNFNKREVTGTIDGIRYLDDIISKSKEDQDLGLDLDKLLWVARPSTPNELAFKLESVDEDRIIFHDDNEVISSENDQLSASIYSAIDRQSGMLTTEVKRYVGVGEAKVQSGYFRTVHNCSKLPSAGEINLPKKKI